MREFEKPGGFHYLPTDLAIPSRSILIKQRLAGSRLHQELEREGFRVGITLVRDYLREVKR